MEKPKDTQYRKDDGAQIFEFGIKKKTSIKDLRLAVRRMIVMLKKDRVAECTVDFSRMRSLPSPKSFGELFAINTEIANYEFTKYKTPPPEGFPQVLTLHIAGKISKAFWDGIERGRIIGNEVNNTRELANTPGGDMIPEMLAQAARNAVKRLPVRVTILGVPEMEKLGMGAILGVGKGSVVPPRFIVLEYEGKREKKPIVLVGKGVTFDTGGLNLKPGNSINEMHMDMSGGAAVIHALSALAKLKTKKHIIGLIPAVENMPSGASYRPGDVLRSMSGKTIEIGNTDAEGRVILADALTYAERYTPRLVIDVATLTGAAEVALGNKCSALFTRSETLAKTLLRIGEETGDRLWQLPLWDEYEEGIKGTHADWSNVGPGGKGGAINGAIFLYQFAKNYPWAHIDMAPMMTTSEGQLLSKGASGVPVQALIRIAETL